MYNHFKKINCDRVAKNYGLNNIGAMHLESNNLLVGINGSGKTRFLNMVKSLCEEEGFLSVYMDFSQLGNKFQKSTSNINTNRQNKDQFNWALLFNIVSGFENFDDFVAYTNNSIEGLLTFIKKSNYSLVAEARFKEINVLLYDILGRKIVRVNNNFYLTERNNVMAKTELSKAINLMSPGERGILYFVFQISIIESLKAEYILLIDEPETHLHPIALTNLIKYIKEKLNPKFSIIATHSVFLLPLYSFDEVKMLDDNTVKKPNSTIYNDIYSKLIGNNDTESNSIYKFLSSIYEWNYSNFLAECFMEPGEVSKGNIKDPQFRKLIQVLSKYSEKEKIRILDFGSGSGRIAKCFDLLEQEYPHSIFWKKLEYFMYDKYKIDDSIPNRKWLKEILKQDYELSKSKTKYDVILLYNVLHEISVEEWIYTIRLIVSLLADGGCLLFSERRVLSKGENPYGQSGYLILEKDELSMLFSAKHIEEVVLKDGENDKTICYVVEKNDIRVPSRLEIIRALKLLNARVQNEIEQTISNGKLDRKYAFYCQEYFNSQQAIKMLSDRSIYLSN